jgi:hypothetical protein
MAGERHSPSIKSLMDFKAFEQNNFASDYQEAGPRLLAQGRMDRLPISSDSQALCGRADWRAGDDSASPRGPELAEVI